MPAFYSHFTFGLEGYKRISDMDLKQLVKIHQSVFTLGLLGPDLFFYFLPDVLLGNKKPAVVMHEYKSNRFFENLLAECERLSDEEQDIAIAYIAGFMGHYAMDTACHPYIYRMAGKHKNSSSWHYSYESAMDIFCCRHFLHCYPSQINQHRLLRLSKPEMRVLCRLAANAYNRTYHLPHLMPATIKGAIGCMHITIAFLNDKKGRKESFVRKWELKLLGYGLISPLFVNFNMYSMSEQATAHFLEMFAEGQRRYLDYLEQLAKYKTVLQQRRTRNFGGKVFVGRKRKPVDMELENSRRQLLCKLGNLSYHSGETCKADYHLYFKK